MTSEGTQRLLRDCARLERLLAGREEARRPDARARLAAALGTDFARALVSDLAASRTTPGDGHP